MSHKDPGHNQSGSVAWYCQTSPSTRLLWIISLTCCKTKSLEKVPSVVQYSSRDPSKYKWGFSVTPESSTTQAPLKWFKLLLNQHADTHDSHVPGSQYPDAHTNRKEKLGELLATLAALPKEKTAIDVVTDYLKGIYTHTLDALKKDYPENFANMIGKEIPLRLVLTVPAVRVKPMLMPGNENL